MKDFECKINQLDALVINAEENKDKVKLNESIDKVTSFISNFQKENSLPNDIVTSLNVLSSHYKKKEDYIEYEDIISKRNSLIQEQIKIQFENKAKNNDYEIIQLPLNEIIDICQRDISYYESTFSDSVFKDGYYQQSAENLLLSQSIKDLKVIKEQCIRLKESKDKFDKEKINELRRENDTLKQEIAKLYDKFKKVRTILEKNHIIKDKPKNQ